MFVRMIFGVLCATFISSASVVSAYELHGKVDIGPTYLELDFLKSGKTEKTNHMGGAKIDAMVKVWGGVCLKGCTLLGMDDHKGRLSSFSVGVAHYTPVTECLSLIPQVGYTWSYIRGRTEIEMLGLDNVKEQFHTTSPYVALEACYKITEKLYINACYQYAWCKTHTKIGEFVDDKSHSCGPSYTLGLEYGIDCNWWINAGIGYNISLSKEKHGIRGKGAKIGVAYYF